MKVVILAAGSGLRLEDNLPKALVRLQNGMTIIEQQIKNITAYFDRNDIFVVVGYKKELIMESFPDLTYLYNHMYASTSAAKSLEKAVAKIKNEDILWLNGDVVFDQRIIEKILVYQKNCMIVNKVRDLGDEEVKYSLSGDGRIQQVSKTLNHAEGEVLGINMIKANDIELLKSALSLCEKKDFAIKAVDIAIQKGLSIFPLDAGDLFCSEIDFPEDLIRVNNQINSLSR